MENQVGQRAKRYDCNFIEPGIVSYRDIGIVLVKKPALDKMAATFNGCPVFNEMHKDVTARDFTDKLHDGLVSTVRYNTDDGWYHAEFYVENEETIRNCDSGYSVSCAYDVTKWGPGGVYHNIPYAAEVLDGVYTHLAIVPNPRYEAARIIYNAKGGPMKLMFWKKNDEVKNASEVELENATVAIGNEEVPISKMITLWNSEEAKKKAEAAAKAMLNDDDTILVDGKRVTVGQLKATYLANAKNEDDETEEEKKKRLAKEAADKKENADDPPFKKKDKDDEDNDGEKKDKKENADDDKKKKDDEDEEKEKEKEKERKNALHFKELQNAARMRPQTFEAPKIMTPDQKVAEGYKRYGPITTGGN